MLPTDPKSLPNKAADPTPDHASFPPASHVEAEPTAPPAPPPALSAAPSLSTLIHAFRRCWKLAVPLAILGGLLAAGTTWMVVPTEYTSTLGLRLLSRPAQGSLENEDVFSNVQKAQTALMKSPDVVSEAIEKSRAEELYGVKFNPVQVGKKLTATFNEGPEVMAVSLSAADPEAAAALLNALGEVYPGKVAAADEERIRNRIAQLRRRLVADPDRKEGRPPTLAEQLRDKRIEQHEAEKNARFFDADTLARKFSDAQDRLRETQQEVRKCWLERTGLESEVKSKEDRLVDPPLPIVSDKDAEDGIATDSGYKKLMKDIEKKRDEIDQFGMVARLTDRKQREILRNLESELEQKERERRVVLAAAKKTLGRERQKQTLEDEKKAIVERKTKIEGLKQQEAALTAEERRWSAKVDELRAGGPPAPPEVLAVRDQVRQLEREQARIGDDLASLEGALPLSPRVTRLYAANVPTERDLNKPIKYTLAASVGVFGLLLVGVCLLEAGGRRVYASSDVMLGLGMRVVGVLPRLPPALRNKTAAQAAAGMDALGLNEAVDAIRTVLMHSPRIDGARVVMVTSAIGGEGKTTLASHLAASLARAWRKTLLIDGDLRNPAQHVQFNQPLEPGLSEALRGEVEFEDAVKPTLTSRLWLMPAGKVDGHSLQALAQEGVTQVFDRLKEQYDFIVMDTSPVLPVPDALLFGKQADAVLLAVMRDVSRLPAVYGAQQRLESLGIRILGAVVIGEKTETYGRPITYPRSVV